MTERSSQPYSSSDQTNITQVQKGGRSFTVTVNQQVGNVLSDSEGNVNKGKSDVKSETTIKSSQPTKQPKKLGVSLSVQKPIEKPASDTGKIELLKIPLNIKYPDTHKPAILHAHFDSKRKKIDPARSLTDIPEPAPRYVVQSESLDDMFARFEQEISNQETSSQEAMKQEVLVKKILEQDITTSKAKNKKVIPKTQPIKAFITQAEQRSHKTSQKKSIMFDSTASKWELIQTSALADHLALLSAGGLAKIPKSFYYNTSVQPLLTSIESMTLVDMSQILSTLDQLSVKYNRVLTRQGFTSKKKTANSIKTNNQTHTTIARNKHRIVNPSQKLPTVDDIRSVDHASTWEAIMYPQRFDIDDMGLMSHLSTDIMATSVVKHALLQCPTRQSINEKMTANDIAKYLRSYLLSQCNQLPHKREHLKHIHIYAGHVIVVAKMLGWHMEVISEGKNKGEVIFNVSSRCGLFARYPLLSDYYVKGWE